MANINISDVGKSQDQNECHGKKKRKKKTKSYIALPSVLVRIKSGL